MAYGMELGLGQSLATAQPSQTRSALHFKSLQEAAAKLADLKSTPKALGTKDLVNLFICQSQRNRRMAQKFVKIHLRLSSPSGRKAVMLRLGATNS